MERTATRSRTLSWAETLPYCPTICIRKYRASTNYGPASGASLTWDGRASGINSVRFSPSCPGQRGKKKNVRLTPRIARLIAPLGHFEIALRRGQIAKLPSSNVAPLTLWGYLRAYCLDLPRSFFPVDSHTYVRRIVTLSAKHVADRVLRDYGGEKGERRFS